MTVKLNKVRGQAADGNAAGVIGPISMKLYPGLTGLVGANGAGKSILIGLLAQVWKPTAGNIVYEMNGLPLNAFEVRQYLGYVPQEIAIYSDMTVGAYLQYIAGLKCLDKWAVAATIRKMSEIFDIAAIRDERLGQLSVGQQRLVVIAQALLGNPAFLFLDEPFENLDIRQRRDLLGMLSEAAQHAVVLVSSHITEEMNREYDTIIKLVNGSIEEPAAEF
ncbi:ABC transporter ATP-binding protein [Paenibacillus oenotherae]|uniref:ABC transporter ATP-binding protein n=1 Tax=Paenibacillus oenotherae TaxID=1435645 RepID=A0ABS7D9M3_9BACL|nr:ABC transporter ATP-binding protein [Paenibacillus oenotherae]MBW7476271.1 ABC transporter ATP-binding protein [Paenibacillus oenotherae]